MRSVWMLVFASLLVTFAACSRDVDEPAFDSPFDPQNPDAGSGWNLQAVVQGNVVSITYQNVRRISGFGVLQDSTLSSTYQLFHDVDVDVPTETATGITYVEPAASAPIEGTHRDYVPERTNVYRVAGGAAVVPSTVFSLDAPLYVASASGQLQTSTLDFALRVRSGVSTTFEVSFDSNFAAIDTFGITPMVARTVDLDLPGFGASGTSLEIFYRGVPGGLGSEGSLVVTPRFDPGLRPATGLRQSLDRGALVAVDGTVTYSFLSDAITALAIDYERPTPTDDVPDSVEYEEIFQSDDPDTFVTFTIEPGAGIEEWTYRFRVTTELGFDQSVNSTFVRADGIGDPSLEILDEGGVTTTRTVRVVPTADQAGSVLLSEDAGFAGATWEAWADTLVYELSDGFGPKTLYAGFRNAFTPDYRVATTSTVLVDSVAPEAVIVPTGDR